MVEFSSDIGSSGNEVELGEMEEHEKDVAKAWHVLEQIHLEEKFSL